MKPETSPPSPAAAQPDRFGAHWKGHVFLFGSQREPTYPARSGLALVLIVVFLEGVVGPRLSLFSVLQWPQPAVWLRVPVLLGFTLLLVQFGARVPLSQLGFRRWREWNATEKSYFLQVLVLANIIFACLFANPLRKAFADPLLSVRIWTVFLPCLIWGFHQELVYRGILQTELVRRWGAWLGILVSNVIFTFGPLHAYHWARGAPAWPIFVGVFAIGLFFGVLFRRSGNLWMVGTFHGVGNMYLEGLSQNPR